jgi:hypothetical protein
VRTTICGGSCAGRLAACLAFAVLGSLAVASPPPAFAGTYTVNVCTPPPSGGAGNGIVFERDPGTIGFGISQTCGAALSRIRQTAAGAEAIGGSRWSLRAPEGTVIRTLTGSREQTSWENPDIVWEVRSADAGLDRIATSIPGGPVNYAVNSDLVFASLVCAQRPCLPRPGNASLSTSISLKNLVATLEDDFPPTVAVDPLSIPGTVRGTIEIPFLAHDEGSGIFTVALLVDGGFVSVVTDTNDGKCTSPIRFLVPCKLDLRSSIPFDTTELSEGAHEVEVVASDIAGESAIAGPFSIDVHNAPDPVGPPPPNPGPPPNPRPSPNTNPSQMADRTAPALSGVSLSRKRFRVGKARTALAAREKATGGTVLRFSSSEAGTLSIAIAKAKKGARPIATLTRSISAAPGKVPLSGRIGKKPLRPGRYRLVLSARDAAGNASNPIALPFTILPPAG